MSIQEPLLFMDSTFIFNDWTAISQIPNQYDSSVRAEGTVIRNCETSQVTGYEVTIYRNDPRRILYRVGVENSQEGEWGLSTTKAVEMLNAVGFRCEYRLPEFYDVLSERQRTVLNSLKELGYTHITRIFSNKGRGSVVATNPLSEIKDFDLNELEDYNYLDWLFLTLNDPTMINAILISNE